MSSSKQQQKTLSKTVSISGVGLFTGVRVEMTLHPAPENSGIRFKRTDLPKKPVFPAHVDYVRGTPRCTVIGEDESSIQTVEHILSALKAYEIDNLLIEVNGPEIPICDGSAQAFVELIETTGVSHHKATKHVRKLQNPIFWSRGDVHLVALPANEFRISYTLSYPTSSSLLRSQFYSTVITEEFYKAEIARCRTFSLYEETVHLIEQGLIKGGSLENAVIIKGDAVLNPEGLRFPDEMVRHKVLDLVGDLSLVGHPFLAHIIAIRSGHFSNTEFAKELVNHFQLQGDA